MSDPVTDALDALARAAGLSPEWWDFRGEHQRVAPSVLRLTLQALGIAAETGEQVAASLQQIEAERDALPALLTAEVDALLPVPKAFANSTALELSAEDGGHHGLLARTGDGGGWLRMPATPGYYTLSDGTRSTRLAVAPPSALPASMQGHRRWGLAAQLYSLPRAGDGGIGDFAALAELARWVGAEGGDAIAISPVHALFSSDTTRFSPYSPSSRLFLNTVFATPDVAGDDRAEPLIDWPRAAAARLDALRARYRQDAVALEGDGALAASFAAFCEQGGTNLLDHARYEAIAAHRAAQGLSGGWREWPPEWQDPRSSAVLAFAEAHADAVRFHCYAQWQAALALAGAQRTAKDAGMAIGIIGDLAVGTDPGGSHAWSLKDALLRGLSVGAPPDLLAGQGQNWGLTTFSPRALRQQGFAPFIDLLRACLAGVGGLRIDHILGLRRLWVVPEGDSAAGGVYLEYPIDDLLKLILLEAHRHGALVIGEDLGTVPPGLREKLAEAGVLGMQVLWFARDHGFFIDPSRYSAHAVSVTSTHDLATLAGWWRGRDLDWRVVAGQFSAYSSEASERAARDEDRRLLWGALRHAGLVQGEPPGPDDTEPVVEAALRFIANTPAPLALVPLEDLLGLVEQPNVPGTIDEHPNWRRRLPLAVAQLGAQPAVTARTAALRAARPRG